MRVARTGGWIASAGLAALCSCMPRVTWTEAPLDDPPAPAQTNAPQAPSAAEREAREIFTTRCTPCHGNEGHGDGVAAAALTPRPRNFADPTWHQTDANIERIIREGGESVGKSPLMPANPDLETRPEVVSSLRTLIRSFATPGPTGGSHPTMAVNAHAGPH